jgi:DNA adenine methylase
LIDGRACWLAFGTQEYRHEPELEAIYMAAQQRIKPILKYPGAKWNLAEWIISHFPAHAHYVEPYFGSGAVFFNKQPAKHEVINDLSGDVVNLFRVIRDDGERLAELIEMTPWAREEYELCGMRDLSDLENARRFIVRCWQGHSQDAVTNRPGWKNKGVHGSGSTVEIWDKVPARVLPLVLRLKRAEIDNRPAVEIIVRSDSADTLIYADPPYVLGTRVHKEYYQHEMTDADHAALLDALDAHPGPVVLSGYHCALYDDRLAHWHTREKQAQAEKGNTRTEVLWLNQTCVDRLGYGPLFATEAA